MTITHLQRLSSHPIRKGAALLIGYMIWYALACNLSTTRTIAIPIIYSQTPEGYSLDAPEAAQVEVRGTRSALSIVAAYHPAIFIKVPESMGEHTIPLHDSAELFLPNTLQLIDYVDPTITIEIKAKEPCE